MVLVFILNSSVPVETYFFFLTPQPQKSFLSPLVHELGPPPLLNQTHLKLKYISSSLKRLLSLFTV